MFVFFGCGQIWVFFHKCHWANVTQICPKVRGFLKKESFLSIVGTPYSMQSCVLFAQMSSSGTSCPYHTTTVHCVQFLQYCTVHDYRAVGLNARVDRSLRPGIQARAINLFTSFKYTFFYAQSRVRIKFSSIKNQQVIKVYIGWVIEEKEIRYFGADISMSQNKTRRRHLVQLVLKST